MATTALTLVLLASFIHAGWNFLTKQSGNRLVFLWLGLAAGLVIYLPAMIWTAIQYPPPLSGLPFILASGSIHFCYYYALSRLYEYDFSLAYPMARGSSPVLVAIISLLFLGEGLSAWGVAGILTVVAGIAALQIQILPSDIPGGRSKVVWPIAQVIRGPAGRVALATALTIACYSVVDKGGVARVNPIIYLWMSHLVAFTAWSFRMVRRWPEVVAEARRSPRAVAAIGVGQNLAYIMVLFAMRLAPVAYVVPAREVSTLIGSALGVVLLREAFPTVKLTGAALIVAGVVLIAALG